MSGIRIIEWSIQDGHGQTYKFIIKKTLYVPNIPHHFLYPQHWAQQANDDTPDSHGIC